jgi:hypothetical protein
MRASWMMAMIAAMSLVPVAASAQDRDGADHPLVPRYAGAEIDGYRAPSQDEVTMPTGAIASEDGTANRRLLTGQVTHIDYRIRPATAPLQIERYYADLLKAAGFETVFACTGPACGRDMGALILNSGKVAPTGLADGLFNDRIRVRVARRGDTWVLIHIADGPDRSQVFETVVDRAAAGS